MIGLRMSCKASWYDLRLGRGARTLACRVDTRVDALPRGSTRATGGRNRGADDRFLSSVPLDLRPAKHDENVAGFPWGGQSWPRAGFQPAQPRGARRDSRKAS